MPALKSGALDASEFSGPWADMALGLHKVAGYYYYPGFHEPGTNNAVGINKGVWEGFEASDRRVIEAVAACEYARSLAEYNANNALSLRKLRDEGTVKVLKFDDALLKTFLAVSKDVVAEIGSGDELSKKIYASYQQFRGFAVRPQACSDTAKPRSAVPHMILPSPTRLMCCEKGENNSTIAHSVA